MLRKVEEVQKCDARDGDRSVIAGNKILWQSFCIGDRKKHHECKKVIWDHPDHTRDCGTYLRCCFIYEWRIRKPPGKIVNCVWSSWSRFIF